MKIFLLLRDNVTEFWFKSDDMPILYSNLIVVSLSDQKVQSLQFLFCFVCFRSCSFKVSYW